MRAHGVDLRENAFTVQGNKIVSTLKVDGWLILCNIMNIC